MKVYVVTSSVGSAPLAEVRTDGSRMEFIVDNTNGNLPSAVGASFDKLQQLVRGSSHLRMDEAKSPTATLVRYVMDNGDVVEITTDGRTVILNGQLVDEQQKMALFQAIKRGEIKVSRRADAPVPVLPALASTPEPPKPPKGSNPSEGAMKHLNEMRKRKRTSELNASGTSDREIDGRDYGYSDDPAFSKAIAYYARHGTGGPRG